MPAAKTVDDVEPLPREGAEVGAAAAGAPGGNVPPDPGAAAPASPGEAPGGKLPQGAAAPAAPSHLSPGTVIDGKYSITRLLGEGGMGVVYVARDIHTDIDVVLKSVRAELVHRADLRARTLAEGRALGQIDHPNVVHLKAVVVDDKSLWLVMQYIEGESLDRTILRHVEQKTRMPLAEALRVFRQIASGIAAAHAEGVIHRDLKPANVLIRRKDQVAKVTDFGIAKVEHDAGVPRVQTQGVIGSIGYMSPEQVTGRRDLDKRVDIYALGIVLFQMLTGHVPFDGKSDYEVMRAHAEKPMPLASAERPDLPASVDAFIQKLCAKKREDRFASCEDALVVVAAIEAEIEARNKKTSVPAPPIAPAEIDAAVATPPAAAAPTPDAAKPAAAAPPDASPASRPPSPAQDAAAPATSKDATSKDSAPKDAASKDAASTEPTSSSPPAAPTKRRGTALWVAAIGVAAVAVAVALIMTGVIPPPASWLGTVIPSSATAPPASSRPPPR